MARVFITGGVGFIGSRLSLRLRAAGHEVTVLDNLNRQVHRSASSTVDQPREAGVHLTPGDVRDQTTLVDASIASGAGIVAHLAAETSAGQSIAARCVASAQGHFSLTEGVTCYRYAYRSPKTAH